MSKKRQTEIRPAAKVSADDLMAHSFFDPSPEQIEIVLIGKSILAEVQLQITSCEACDTEAIIPIQCILDELTGRTHGQTEYLLEMPLSCLRCGGQILENTDIRLVMVHLPPLL